VFRGAKLTGRFLVDDTTGDFYFLEMK